MSSTEHLLESPPSIEYAYPERALVRHYPSAGYASDSESTLSGSTFSSLSTKSSMSSITVDLEKQDLEKHDLSEKKGIHGLRSLRYRFFCIYRRLFTIVFFANVLAMVLLLRSPKERQLNRLAIAMAANLTASILLRQDHIVNILYAIACSVPKSAPLWFRRRCAQIYHMGGLHSGFAVASVFWLVAFTVLATVQKASLEVLIITYFIDAFLILILALAHPTFRVRFHDHFEMVHRFAGWTCLTLFWIQTVLFVSSRTISTHDLGRALLHSANIWLLSVSTASILFPWLELRKVPVNTVVLSSHAARIDFPTTSPIGPAIPGTAVRLSTRPLFEWHSFATIAQPGQNGFSVIVSKAGDWTSRIISHPPTSLYIRGVPTCGFMRVVPVFKSIVLVATGSGIAPLLPHIYAQDSASPEQRQKMPKLRIFWSTPNPEQTFGKDIVDVISRVDPEAVVHDTKSLGRPDMLAVSWKLLMESGAEAVAIVSNKKLTDKVVYGIEARGYPAFGALWDS